jgi:hypothetical protein
MSRSKWKGLYSSIKKYSNNQNMDILSNGFKCRNSDTLENGSGNTIIYAAFAENPFNSSRAR